MKQKYLIYALCEPTSGEVRYVGKSCSGLYRPRSHTCKSVQSKTYVYNWIRSLQAVGAKPQIKVLETFDSAEPLAECEQFYISYLRSLGARLTNLTDGGDGVPGRKVSIEERKRISESNKVWQTEAARKQISDRLKEYYKDPAARARLSENAKRQFTDPESRKKAGEKSAARFNDPAFRKKMSDSQKKRFADPEERARLSAQRKGVPNPKKCRPVVDQFGRVYPSIKAAAAALSVSTAAVSKSLARYHCRIKGFKFTYFTEETL